MIELDTISNELEKFVLETEKKFSGGELPKSTESALNRLKTISKRILIANKEVEELERQLEVRERSQTLVSYKYCKSQLFNVKLLKQIEENEKTIERLKKGL